MYTREYLIDICKEAVNVPIEEWDDRDSFSALVNVEEIYTKLMAGMEFEFGKDSNERTIWIYFINITQDQIDESLNYSLDYPDINDFREKYGYDYEMFDSHFTHPTIDGYNGGYLPTWGRLREANGSHWY